jgi:hypothetical protein
MSLVLQSSGGGQITIQEPATASNFTQTLPAASGEVMVSGNQPAFSAFTPTQTLTTAVLTLLAHSTELFDTASCFNNTGSTVGGILAYSFLPNVAGYYQITASVRDNTGASAGFLSSVIQKNGVAANQNIGINNAQGISSITTALIYLNGTTDYIQHYAQQNSGLNMSIGGQSFVYFQATLVRAA